MSYVGHTMSYVDVMTSYVNDDVVYDIGVLCRDYTIPYVPVYIGIIRYRTSISSKTNEMTYDVACDIVTYDMTTMTYDVACLSFLAQWALATDTWGSQAVTQQSRAVPELYYT